MKAVAVLLLVMCHLAVSHAWTCTEAPQLPNIMQIDAGEGHVVARDASNSVYMLQGTTWFKLGSPRLKHVTAGPAGIWGVDTSDRVYKSVNGQFEVSSGIAMQQVDAGGDGQVVGIGQHNVAYCLKSDFAAVFNRGGYLSWLYNSASRTYYSCGPKYGCWAIDEKDGIWFTKEFSPNTCSTNGWQQVEGAAVMVEVGTDGNVFVVNQSGNVYQRAGVTAKLPQGTDWTQIKMCFSMRHVSYDQGRLWVVSTGGILMQCTP